MTHRSTEAAAPRAAPAALKRALSRGYLTILVKRLDHIIVSLEHLADRAHSPHDFAELARIRDEITQLRLTLLNEIRHHS